MTNYIASRAYELKSRKIASRGLRSIYRNRAKIFLTGLVFCLLTLGALLFVPPLYSSKVVIGFNSQQAASGQKDALLSRAVIVQAINEIGLLNDYVAKTDGRAFGLKFSTNVKINDIDSSTVEKIVLAEQIRRNTDVQLNKSGYGIILNYRDTDPVMSARIANAIAEIYLQNRFKKQQQTSRIFSIWLEEKGRELESKLADAEKELAQLRRQNNFSVLYENGKIIPPEEIQARLLSAKSEKRRLEGRMGAFEEVKDNPDALLRIPDIFNDPLIKSYREQAAILQKQVAELSTRYGERHPKLAKATAALSAVTETMNDEIMVHAQIAAQEKSQLTKKIEELEAGLKELEKAHEDFTAVLGDIAEKERQVGYLKAALHSFTRNNINTVSMVKEDAEIVSRAEIPIYQVFPNRKLFAGLSFVLGSLLAMIICAVSERTNNVVRSMEQLEMLTGLDCLGSVPVAQKMQKNEKTDYIFTAGAMNLAESLRALRVNLHMRQPAQETPPKVITLTSSYPGEGKTTMSSWMARLAARSGQSVIVVDCDLRRPSLSTQFDEGNEKTLVEYLTGQATLREVIKTDHPYDVHTIFAKPVPNNALDLISSLRLQKLILSLRKAYDLVILDSPAALAVSDPVVLSKYADHTIYIVSWNESPQETILGGLKQFEDSGVKNLSLVLNKVDMKGLSRYGYTRPAYYNGNYGSAQVFGG
jgi:capsular exopolysaccharide synthesis family protein